MRLEPVHDRIRADVVLDEVADALDVDPGVGRVGLAGAGGTAEPGDRLADLGPVEEAGGAAHDVRDAARGERLLERLGERVDAEEDRDLAQGAAGAAQITRLRSAGRSLSEVG